MQLTAMDFASLTARRETMPRAHSTQCEQAITKQPTEVNTLSYHIPKENSFPLIQKMYNQRAKTWG
jgi:hypothetical protein